ncbi:MAG: transposase [Methylocella sp.]
MTDQQAHWENVYTTKGEAEVSWFQETPVPSLELLELVGAQPSSAIIDIGGGASRLVDSLVTRASRTSQFLTCQPPRSHRRARLGDKGGRVKWIVADATEWQPPETYDVWHDRAAFHVLTDEKEQNAYIQQLKQALLRGGHVIIGTFAPDGPEKCSGLPVARHSAESRDCPLRPRCTNNYRAVSRLENEDALDRMAARLGQRPDILARRREIVEHPFGTIKQWMNQGAFLMRGLDKVRAEFSLTALVYNLRRALNILGVARLMAAVAG